MQGIQVRHYGKQNKKVVFLIGGWTYKPAVLWLPANMLAKNGYYCITYTYPNDTFSPNYQKTVKDILAIKDAILLHIKQLKNEGYETFSIFGTSLGTVIATLVANESPDVSKVILNTTGADTAASVWSWDEVNASFKKALVAQHMTLEKLINYWKPISQEYNMNNLKGKKLLIYLSKNDQIIPYTQGERFVQKCEENNYTHQVIINHHLRHRLAGIYNLLHAKTYVTFIDS